jgi:hypothetical protein
MAMKFRYDVLVTRYLIRSFDVTANPVLLHSAPHNSCSVRRALRTESQTTIGAPRTTPTATYSCTERLKAAAAIPKIARSMTPGTTAFQRGTDLGSWSGLTRTGGGTWLIIVGSSKIIPTDHSKAIGTEVMRTISRSFARTIVTAKVSNATRVVTIAHARVAGTTGMTGLWRAARLIGGLRCNNPVTGFAVISLARSWIMSL